MQWKNPDGSITTGVVIEDGAGAKLTSFSGGGGSNANFTPNGNTTQLSVSTTSARVALPAGMTVMVYNTGAQPAFVAFGAGGVVATTAGDEVPAGGALPFAPSGATYIAAIAAGGGTSLNITGGSGLGFALSGGSSGGGSSVTQSGAWAVSISGTPTVQSAALAPIVTPSAASALQLKASAGNLLSLMATSTVSGWLMLFDATAAPADGAVTPKWVYPLAANGALNMAWPNPLAFATGIIAVFSTTGPFTKTASATAFISGQAQ